MKNETIKGLIKYIGIFILIAYFVLNVFSQIGNYTYARFIFSDAEKNGTKEELILDLQELEDSAKRYMEMYEDDEIPALGAVVAAASYGRDYYAIDMLTFSIILGAFSGLLVYILKNVECKKIVHYIVIYLLLLIVLTLIVMIGTDLINAICRESIISGIEEISVGGFFEDALIVGIPYTIIYILACIIIYLVNKYKAQKLNSEM